MIDQIFALPDPGNPDAVTLTIKLLIQVTAAEHKKALERGAALMAGVDHSDPSAVGRVLTDLLTRHAAAAGPLTQTFADLAAELSALQVAIGGLSALQRVAGRLMPATDHT